MSRPIDEAVAWSGGLRLAVQHGADAATAFAVADRARKAAGHRNALVELFGLLGSDQEHNQPLAPQGLLAPRPRIERFPSGLLEAMKITFNGIGLSFPSFEEFVPALDRFDLEPQFELWISCHDGPSLAMLRNGDHAWLRS